MSSRGYKYGAVLKMQNALQGSEREQFDEIRNRLKEKKITRNALSKEDKALLDQGTKLPKEAIDELYKAKQLRNQLVKLHNEHWAQLKRARGEVDPEYKKVQARYNEVQEKVDKAYAKRREARAEAGTRDTDHPLISEANEKIKELQKKRKKLSDEEWKPAKKQADKKLGDAWRKAFNKEFDDAFKKICAVKNSGIGSETATAIGKYFKTAREMIFQTPGAKLRRHRFDGTGFWHYEVCLREKNNKNKNGTTLPKLLLGNQEFSDDGRAFVLTEKKPTKKENKRRPIYEARIKIAGGAKKTSKIYGYFDITMHRPIPDNAQIQNAKLVRRRTGDKFSYTVSFTLRLPDIQPCIIEGEVIGMDLGFREFTDGKMRVATLATDKGKHQSFIELPKGEKSDYLNRMEYIETIRGKMDKSATELGKRLLPWLKTAKPLPEDHRRFIFVKKLKNIKSNVTLDYERAYKMARWFMAVPQDAAHFGPEISNLLRHWWEANSRKYREMHNLRRKALAARKEFYRIEAAKIVARGLPIAVEEDLNLSRMAKKKDKDNPLSSKALSNRFEVAPGEFRDALKNAAEREGLPFLEVSAYNTSKKCNACGEINKKLRSEAEWVCAECGCVHDRDINAAINIAKRGYEKLKKKNKKPRKK